MGMNESVVGFYSLEKLEDEGGYMGALLVTDDLGMPEEFRVTYPVKPTPLQAQLYGDSLLPHIAIQLCGVPLFNSLRTKPAVLILRRPSFLPMSRDIQAKVVALERLGDSLVLDGEEGGSLQVEKIEPSRAGFSPVSITYPTEYDSDVRSATRTIVNGYFEGIDLLEPFERISGALSALAKQDERFR